MRALGTSENAAAERVSHTETVHDVNLVSSRTSPSIMRIPQPILNASAEQTGRYEVSALDALARDGNHFYAVNAQPAERANIGNDAADPTEGAIRVQPEAPAAAPGDASAQDRDYEDSDDDDEGDDGEPDGLHFQAWLQQGISFSAVDPADRYNGVVGMNDRDADWMGNQLWLGLVKRADSSETGFDIGGEFATIYGTDAQYLQMQDGLEESWDQTAAFYQVALLRFYTDVAIGDWTLRAGKFDVMVGYEPIEATKNFFYSHSYSFIYGTPFTLLGAMATRQINDNVAVNAGLHRGTNQFDDTDGWDRMDYLGGITFSSDVADSWLDCQFIAEEKGVGDDSLWYSLVGHTLLTSDLELVLEHTFRKSSLADAEGYGVGQWLMRRFNDKWATGIRAEWYRDDDGSIVRGVRNGNVAQGPFVGDFYAVTWAVNYSPRPYLNLRPELRYDWYDEDASGGPRPFDAGNQDDQLMGSLDCILTY